jgi:hypothetical protein
MVLAIDAVVEFFFVFFLMVASSYRCFSVA